MIEPEWTRGLYAITDEALLSDDQRLFSACDAALRGGLALLQYRDKSDDGEKRWRQASELAARCAAFDVPLIINDDVALAARLRSAGHQRVGVHLGQQDGHVDEARYRLGPMTIVGVTCHGRLELAERAAAEGASYLAFGRFFASRTKPSASPASLSLLGEAKRFGLPRVAIGGIAADNIATVRQAGADLVAAVDAIFGGEDPESRVSELNRRLAAPALDS
ncbi:thiamine-phosphate diphosphorylase [Onishia taeanensis]|uniref:Thiamine-phosphate synthase n=1 Tax=Onishia taeanensis TaxID=284577 RepID=A0A1G7RWS4_9GAMM|nr:thiamine phosphate synthase [Halomonas taeanensis]MAX32236.1 thiamine phosphate synthase [Halomonadaceae bacterium]SDG15191.1 thiamine-phosphate diphosphorylase [Halomonas taeanensis]